MSLHKAKSFLPIFNATLLALGGVVVFLALELPLPWLLGTIFPLLFFSHFERVTLATPKSLMHPARGILGVAVGAAFTPAIIESLEQYLLSLMFMVPFLALVIIVGKLYYQRIVGFDKDTSVFCALPGGLLEMTLICEAYGADLKRVVLTHTTRVILIIYIVPFLIQVFTGYDLSGNLVLPSRGGEVAWGELLLLLFMAIGGWYTAKRINLSGASLIGPMLFCAPLYLFGWVSLRLPGELINLAQLILGIRIGLSLTGTTLGEIGRYFVYALGLFLLVIMMCLSAAYVVHLVTDIPLIPVLLAYVPGGQAEMNVIAIIIGIHVPFIALHHLMRMFLLIAFAPAIKRLFDRF